MDALHAVGLQGGWPLTERVLTLPMRSRFMAAYFRNKWIVLITASQTYAGEHRTEHRSTGRFMEVIGTSELIKYGAQNRNAAQEADYAALEAIGVARHEPGGVFEFKLLVCEHQF
jgi:hypothetical protein